MSKKGVNGKSILILIILLSIFVFVSISLVSSESLAYKEYKKDSIDEFRVHGDVNTKMAKDGLVDVIIMFDDDPDAVELLDDGTIKRKNSRKSKEVVSSVQGFNKRHDLGIINGYSGTLTRKGLNELKERAEIEGVHIRVFENKPNYLHSSLAMCTYNVGANYSWDNMNITGRNITVAVMDSGVDYTHPDFGACTYENFTDGNCSKFVGGYDFVDDEDDPIDEFGHGTMVAGILSANGSYRGVAPDSKILIVRVCNAGGGCLSDDDIINATQWAVDQNVSIITFSLGRYASPEIEGNTGKDALSTAIDNFVDQGVIIVNSAGNDGPGTSTINIAGSAEKTITVGAIDDLDNLDLSDDFIWGGSSRGPGAFGRLDPDIVAPGVDIWSTYLCSITCYTPNTGASMATPFVTGAVALLLEQNPLLTPSQVRAILLQSTRDVNGKVFEKGAGSLSIQNALTGNIYALINYTNPYNQNVINDRWEFVLIPYTTSYANVTIINNNAYDVTFDSSMQSITNLENALTLDTNQLDMPSMITVSANSNLTFQINFTLDDYNNSFATTYGGIIYLNGTGNNGTDDINKSLRIPVIITIPISNNRYLTRQLLHGPWNATLDGWGVHEDVYQYCYYNPNARNTTITINWTSASDDINLYLYNSTGDYGSSDIDGVNIDDVNASGTQIFYWFRIDGYDFSPPAYFNINVSSIENNFPSIDSIDPIRGVLNGTNILFYRPDNLTINITYSDLDNDSVNVTINDTGYLLIDNASSNGNGYALFSKEYDAGLENASIIVTLTDVYGGISTQILNVRLQSSVVLNSYSPLNHNLYVLRNNSIDFTIDATDINNQTLYYNWTINSTSNASTQNYTFNTTGLDTNLYVVGLRISNNDTNNDSYRTLSWNIFVDGDAPIINIQNPTMSIYNQSKIDLNYTVIDWPAGRDTCWYSINGTTNSSNTTLSSCTNTSIYLSNGNYTLTVYSNDTLTNLGLSNVNFEIGDASPPIILNTSPNGTLSYTTSVTLIVYTDENASCKYSTTNISYISMTGSFSDNITRHTTSHAVSEGLNTLYVRCADMSNNINNDSVIIEFEIGAAPEPPPDGDGGSGGSGGSGGGSGGFGYDPNPGTESETFTELSEGITDVDMYDKYLPVSRVTVNSSMNLTNITLTTTKTDTPEENYTEDVVYSYLLLNFTSENNYTGSIDDFITTGIYFSVSKQWMMENNLTNEEIILLEYVRENNTWIILPTEYLNEDDTNVYFVSQSSGSGLYAISTNRTQDRGNPVYNEPELPKVNQTTQKNMSTNATLHSDSKTIAGSRIVDTVKGLVNDLKKQKENLWIVWVLCTTFILVVMVMKLLKGKEMNKYKDDLIRATDKEFNDATRILDKKVPVLPEDIRAKLSSMVNQRFSDVKKQESIRRETPRVMESQDISQDVSKDVKNLKNVLNKNK